MARSRAVNDFQLTGIESYVLSDYVSELTARTNDDGCDTSYREWLKISRLFEYRRVLVFSVGGRSVGA